MHPLAHMLTGALIGQVAPHPATAVLGGFFSHHLLDAIPHTEGKTFNPQPDAALGAEIVEAGLEFGAGILILTWLIGNCDGSKPLPIVLGSLAALLPDLVDLPLRTLFGINLLHVPGLHWTVQRRHAAWGILTQMAVAGTAIVSVWRASGCG